MTSYIQEYHDAIESGKITAGKRIRQLYEIITVGIKAGVYFYDEREALAAVRFVERFIHHNKGPLAPSRLRLELWEKALLSLIFAVKDKDGRRQFREVAIIIGRKMGKSLLAAAIIAYVVYIDPEYGKDVYCVAPKLEQSDMVYGAFEFSVNHEPSLKKITRATKRGLKVDKSASTIQRIAFNEKKSDGFNPALAVADEFAAWPAARGLKQYEVLVSGFVAREQPLILSISSGGYVDGGIYDELVKRGTAFLNGDSRESRLLPVFYMVDNPQKWKDMNELRKSMPGLGISVREEVIQEAIAVAESSLSKKAEFLCKYANIKQNSSVAWLPSEIVNAACGEHLELADFQDVYCVGGVDLSRTTDLTCCAVVIERGGELYVFAQFFMPAEKIEEATARDGIPYQAYIERGLLTPCGENFVDYKACFAWFTRLVEEYRIYPLQTGYDRYSSTYLVQDMKQYGFHMDDVFQGYNLTPVIQETEGLLRDGKIHIGDNDLLKIHLLDSALKVETESERCKLIKLGRTSHIDGTATLLDAMCVRQKYYEEIGGQLKNEESS